MSYTFSMRDFARSLATLGVLLACATAPIRAIAAPPPWSWSTEKIDSQGTFPSMLLDSHDNVHVIYVSQGQQLVYSYRPSDTKKWWSMPVAPGRTTTSVALDSRGRPSVAFELADGQLWFTSFNGTRWQQPGRISPEFGQIMYTCTVAIDQSDKPHVFWYQVSQGSSEFYHIRHAELSGGRWNASTLDSARETGKWHSAIAGANGELYVVYSAFPDAQLRLAHFDGKKDWSYEVIDSRPPGQVSNIHPIFGASITLGKDGSPLVSYEDENQIKFAHRADGHWVVETVDPILPFSNREKWWELRTSIALDRAGVVHVVYQDGGAVKHAFQEDGKWRVETLVTSGADSSRFASLAAGKDGNLYMVYRDPDDGALMLATGQPSKAGQETNTATASSSSRTPEGTAKKN